MDQTTAEATAILVSAWLLAALPPWIYMTTESRCVAILHTGTGRVYVPALPTWVN